MSDQTYEYARKRTWLAQTSGPIDGWSVLTNDSQRVADTASGSLAWYIAEIHNMRLGSEGHSRFGMFAIRPEPLEAPPVWTSETTASMSWLDRWVKTITEAVQQEDPWGLLGMRPDGDYHLFDADPVGIRRATEYPSAKVWLLFPEWKV